MRDNSFRANSLMIVPSVSGGRRISLQCCEFATQRAAVLSGTWPEPSPIRVVNFPIYPSYAIAEIAGTAGTVALLSLPTLSLSFSILPSFLVRYDSIRAIIILSATTD